MNWLSFANPWLLAGLAAAGLPVLIHYLTRARPRRVAFPPFKFLEEACAGQQALHRLRTIVLLTVRGLAVLVLVLWFSRPFLKPAGALANPQARQRVVLMLDASLSMRAVQRGVPLFTGAKGEAGEVLRGLEPNTEAAVILVGATPRSLLPALSPNLPTLHDQLVQAEPTFENGDFSAALALAQRLLGGAGTVYIFSDFQKSNWETARELPGGLICRLRPVTTEPVENLALTSARLLPEEPVAGENAEVVCTMLNGTARPREQTVRLELGDFTQERRVTVPAFGMAEAAFSVAFPREGTFTGRAWLDPDDLREDNTRYLVVRVHKALQVLLLSDAEAGDPRSAAFFVSRALAPSASVAPGLNLVRRHSQDTDRGILETADLFLLVAPAAVSGEAVEIITRRVQEGARFLAILDGPTAPSLVFAAFNPPFQLQRTVFSEAGEALVPGPGKLFAEGDAADWAGVRFRRHYLNQVPAARKAEVLLAYPDGSAALTCSTVGKGAAAFANLPLAPESGDFVGSPMFPATLHELMRLLRRNSDSHQVVPGTAWVLDASTKGDGSVTVMDPADHPLAAQVLSSGRSTRLAMAAAAMPGLYLAKQADAIVGAEAVNIDPREADTRPIALEQLKGGPSTAISVVRDEEDLLLAGKARPLWPQVAAATVGLLALEMVLLALWRPARATGSMGTPNAWGGSRAAKPVKEAAL